MLHSCHATPFKELCLTRNQPSKYYEDQNFDLLEEICKRGITRSKRELLYYTLYEQLIRYFEYILVDHKGSMWGLPWSYIR